MAIVKDGLPVILFESEDDWAQWLEDNHNSKGIWLQIAKKKSGIASVSYEKAVDVALCYGWIDGLKNAYDSGTWVQRFTQRKSASKWSKVNKEKALQFIAQGKMKPSGLATVEMAKIKGTWDTAYDSQSNAKVPDDLMKALDINKDAGTFFESLDGVNKYAIIYRMQTARTPEIRAKKLAELIEMLNRKEKIHN